MMPSSSVHLRHASMTDSHQGIYVIIPAFNEEKSVAKVLGDIPSDWVTEVIVVNNNSTDDTAGVAASAGATVLNEKQAGYGNACLKGLEYLKGKLPETGIVVFLDADYSDHSEQLPSLLQPILHDNVDMVIGSRSMGKSEKDSMTFVQKAGNRLACFLIGLLFGVRFTDLGPFRAIRYESLMKLDMKDRNYGWTVEMQVKAVKQGLKCTEVPVDYRRRIGKSKVSGTVKGSIMAGYKILLTILKYA